MASIYLASAMVLDQAGRLLTVRKHNSSFYMMPGGKIEAGEEPLEALLRELQEELGIQLNAQEVTFLGIHKATAVNEKNTTVVGHVFKVVLTLQQQQDVQAQAEIAEACWISKSNYSDYQLAHLLEEFTLPRWLAL